MENYAELGKDRLLNLKCRVNQPSVPRVLRFLNSDGSAHPITDYAFRIPVWKTPNATNPIFTLTIDDGLTVQGDGLNELLIEVSEERATVTPNVYFWLLEGLAESEYQAWLNGDWEFYIGKYNGVEQTEDITINTAEEVVTIVVGENSQTLDTRVRSTTSTATLTPNVSLYDMEVITAQSEALLIANPTGTAVNGNAFMIDVTDNGTARAITFGDDYVGYAVALPSTTILGKGMKMVFQYSSVTETYDLLTVINEI
jgi:hypothetical protein